MKMFAMFWIIYGIVGIILGSRKAAENGSKFTFAVTLAIMLGVILFLIYENYGKHSLYWNTHAFFDLSEKNQ